MKEVKDKTAQKVATYTQWSTECNAVVMTGKFANVPVCDYDGEEMIMYLRHLQRLGFLQKKPQSVQNAVRRKLQQYEGVTWLNGFPMKKPKPKFDYHAKMFRYMT